MIDYMFLVSLTSSLSLPMYTAGSGTLTFAFMPWP